MKSDDQAFVVIRPVRPVYVLVTCAVLLSFSIALLMGPDGSIGAILFTALSFSMAALFAVVAEYCFASIYIYSDRIEIAGYFKLYVKRYSREQVLGYAKRQRYDEANGLHDMLVLVFTNGKTRIIPKIAYPDYRIVNEHFSNNFEFLGLKPLRFAEFYQATVPVISALSGLFALIVALKKWL